MFLFRYRTPSAWVSFVYSDVVFDWHQYIGLSQPVSLGHQLNLCVQCDNALVSIGIYFWRVTGPIPSIHYQFVVRIVLSKWTDSRTICMTYIYMRVSASSAGVALRLASAASWLVMLGVSTHVSVIICPTMCWIGVCVCVHVCICVHTLPSINNTHQKCESNQSVNDWYVL